MRIQKTDKTKNGKNEDVELGKTAVRPGCEGSWCAAQSDAALERNES